MVRNNAPGGGGNDWAIDDIALATCMPNLNLNPSPNLTVCVGNTVDMSTVINCYFPNYIYWTWEKSTDNGFTWTNTGVSGTGSPVLVGGQWQYTATYPTFLADMALNHAMFRIKVASTAANLSDANCAFVATTTVQVLTSTCMILPGNQLLYFKGKLQNGLANLEWTTTTETPELYFEIEKSTDGLHFQKIGTTNAVGKKDEEETYAFRDAESVTGTVYYRLKLISNTGIAYSHVVTLYGGNINFEIKSLLNPFDSYLSFDAIAPADVEGDLMLFDSFGRMIKQQHVSLTKGYNRVNMSGLGSLSDGTYFLRVQTDNQSINKRVIKIKN